MTGFLVDVDDSRNGHLHAVGQFVAGHSRLQLGVLGVSFGVAGVEDCQLFES